MNKMILATFLVALPMAAHAQVSHSDMQMGISGADPKVQRNHMIAEGTGSGNPAALAFMKINQNMHKSMAIKYTGDTDVDFVKGMIPHHQGAVDMAKIELESGTDPEIKAMAQAVIDSQEKEIATMKKWLAKHDKK